MSNCADSTSCVILAAGEGKRMHAKQSKVLCEVSGKPMLRWVIDAARAAGIKTICVVASGEDVKSAADGCEIREQKERLGTGHAVMCARDFLAEHPDGDTLVLCGDAPFIDRETIAAAHAVHAQAHSAVTVISAVVDDPKSYGRIIRKGDALSGIIEAADCDDSQAKIREINSGAYWFRTDALLQALSGLKNDNAQGEYYLTDAVALLLAAGERASCYTASSSDVVLGANRPADLLELNELANRRAIERHLANGVHFIARDGIVIGPDVEIAPGAIILPGCMLYGSTKVGAGAKIGPNSLLSNLTVGENTVFNASQGYDSVIGANAKIGPFVHIRPDSVIDDRVKIGDYVEVKNSHIGEGTSLAHLTYIGDSEVGKHCNFGCGVVVVNYDGEVKNRTTVGDFAFIGCNTNLVAPVQVGDGAYTAAGTTVTKDVPAGALAVGRARQTVIEGWAAKKLQKYIAKKSK